MIVQSVDGKFYLNPAITAERWSLVCGDRVEFQYKRRGGKDTSWKTARTVLEPAGISARLVSGPYFDQQILGGSLEDVTTYVVRLTHPIPAPSSYEAVLNERPADGDFEIIEFSPKGRRK